MSPTSGVGGLATEVGDSCSSELMFSSPSIGWSLCSVGGVSDSDVYGMHRSTVGKYRGLKDARNKPASRLGWLGDTGLAVAARMIVATAFGAALSAGERVTKPGCAAVVEKGSELVGGPERWSSPSSSPLVGVQPLAWFFGCCSVPPVGLLLHLALHLRCKMDGIRAVGRADVRALGDTGVYSFCVMKAC